MPVKSKLQAYKDVSVKQWNDWTWQLDNRLSTVDDIVRVLNPSRNIIEGMEAVAKNFKLSITPYYASLIDMQSAYCPIKSQAIPTFEEGDSQENDFTDPLEEDRDSPVPGLTHRYPDRVLLLVTDVCSMYCRHCTRRRMVGQEDRTFNPRQFQQAVDYIAAHEEVRDIVISGGDPLMLSDRKLEKILRALRAIPHVEIIRLGTRLPVVLPQRITPSLIKMLRQFHPIYISTHFNHSKEITPESSKACTMLADGGFPISNQTVLLRGVNDCPHVIKELNQKLLTIRVRPYYLFQCDLSRGISHFRTSLGRGIQIIESLRGHTSGLAVPTFVVDLPGGGGKVPVMPNYCLSSSDDKTVLRNFEGAITVYQEPHSWESVCGHDEACSNEKNKAKAGPAMLMSNPRMVLEPHKRQLGRRIVKK